MSDEFWDAAAPLLADGEIDEGSIMGGPCVRVSGEFVGMPHHKGPGIVVKLDRERVAELIDDGEGRSFAPAGKVFREWVSVPAREEVLWRDLLEEALEFNRPG